MSMFKTWRPYKNKSSNTEKLTNSENAGTKHDLERIISLLTKNGNF